MPPLSPLPGCTRGEVWSESTATRRTGDHRTQALRSRCGRPVLLVRALGAGVLVHEGLVHAEEGLLLGLGQALAAEDGVHNVTVALSGVEETRPGVQRLRRDGERLGDLLEDLGRRLAQTALDLAQVGVRDPGQVGELAEGDPRRFALFTDEAAHVLPAGVAVDHLSSVRPPGGVAIAGGTRRRPRRSCTA